MPPDPAPHYALFQLKKALVWGWKARLRRTRELAFTAWQLKHERERRGLRPLVFWWRFRACAMFKARRHLRHTIIYRLRRAAFRAWLELPPNTRPLAEMMDLLSKQVRTISSSSSSSLYVRPQLFALN